MRQCPRQFDARHDAARSSVDLVASAEFEFGVGPERLTSLIHPTTDGRVTARRVVKPSTTAIGRKRE
jgi:hypothetical protein